MLAIVQACDCQGTLLYFRAVLCAGSGLAAYGHEQRPVDLSDSLEVRRNAVLRAAQSEAATWLYEVAGLCAVPDRRDTHSGHSRLGRGPMPLPGSVSGGQFCRQRTNALKIAGGSLREKGVTMSWNVPGGIPAAPVKDDTPPCARCGHRAGAHLNTGFCSARRYAASQT